MNEKRRERMNKRFSDGKGEKPEKDLEVSLIKDEVFSNAYLFLDEMIMRYGKNLSAPVKHVLKSGQLNLLIKTEAQRISKKEFASYDHLEEQMRNDRYILDKTQFEDGLKESARRAREGYSKPVTVGWIERHGATRKQIKAIRLQAKRDAEEETRKRKRESTSQLHVSKLMN